MLRLDDFQLFFGLLNDRLLLLQALFNLSLDSGQAARHTHRLFNPVNFGRNHVHLDLVGLKVVLVFNLKHLLRQTLVYRFYEVASLLLLLQDVLAVSS